MTSQNTPPLSKRPPPFLTPEGMLGSTYRQEENALLLRKQMWAANQESRNDWYQERIRTGG